MDTLENLRSNLERFKVLRQKVLEELELIDQNIASMEKLEKWYLKGNETIVSGFATYPTKSSWGSKILFVLQSSAPVTPPKMALLLEGFEKIFGSEKYTSEHLLNIASQYLPKMFKDGLVDRVKEGRNYAYSIKDKK